MEPLNTQDTGLARLEAEKDGERCKSSQVSQWVTGQMFIPCNEGHNAKRESRNKGTKIRRLIISSVIHVDL